MKRLALLAAGVCALTTGARADGVPASISNQSPDQAAMSEAITQLLTKQLGESALWTKLVGRPRQFNEFLYVNVPEHAITLGRAAFDNNVRFQVRQSTQWVENCNGTQDYTETVETTSDVVNSYYNTQAHNSESTLSHTVTLDAKVGSGLGTYVETSYSFNHTDNSSENSTTRNDQSNEKMVKETLTLVASPGQSVAYQTNQVVLSGTRATFTAQASINTATALDFYLHTVGTLNPDVGVSGIYVAALDNSPVPGQPHAVADLRPGNRVLRSPDGAFIFGMETGKGGNAKYGQWSVIDLNSSQPGAPSRLWTPASNTCGATPMDLVMTSLGQLQLRCGSKVTWDAGTSVSNANPCFYLTYAPGANSPGELACYSTNPASGGKITFMSGAIAARTLGDEIRAGLKHVKKSLKDLLPGVGSTQAVSFSGVFDGSLGVLGPINCMIAYHAAPQPSSNGCRLLGLVQPSSTPAAHQVKSKTPSGEMASLTYCGPTNAFLKPYLARNPLSVGGN